MQAKLKGDGTKWR